ncbi:MAG: RsmG family class I SAM-dependent methyltransferase [Acidimicrobiales bacterium]
MDPDRPEIPGAVLAALAEAQGYGFIGPGDLNPHLAHSIGFATALARIRRKGLDPSDLVADLGPGGGLPGLALAALHQDVRFALIEGSARRANFLRQAVDRSGLSTGVEILGKRAELVGRSPTHRGRFTVVVARLLGSPSEVAELGAPLLRDGGHLVVSEPPGDPGDTRWPTDGVGLVGLGPATISRGYAVLELVAPCPDRYPRRVGIPRKRPLF